MKSVSEVTAIVVDHGIFLPIARRLGREFKKVYYFTQHERAFPTVRDCIGDGFEDVERVDSVWDVKEQCDLFVFPDIGFSSLQRELLAQGKIVWGARDADSIEISRGKFLRSLMETSLPVAPYHKIIGMSSLRDHLQDKTDKWIKISKYRGDWETMHFRDMAQDEMELDARAVILGPWKELIPFYVFDEIETTIEDGCDTYCIDGAFPSLVIHGMEAKDKAYLGTFQKLADLPEEVRCVTDAFGPILAGYGYRSLFSAEVRITEKGESYFIDPTLRAGSPPSQVMCEMIGNLGEIFWHGAQGELIDPVPEAKFGVQALVSIKGDRMAWGAMEVSEELDRWLKCGFCSRIGSRIVFPPDKDSPSGDVGWLVGIGDTMEQAINHLRKNTDALPCGCSCQFTSLTELLQEVHEAEDKGMEFTDQEVPDPESVVSEEKS